MLFTGEEYSMFAIDLTSGGYISYIYQGNANFVLLVEDMWLGLLSLWADLSSATDVETIYFVNFVLP